MHPTLDRLHYMDNLRAVIMIAGVLFHAALAYTPYVYPIWLTADGISSPVIEWGALFLHAFRMPLFFLIAGFFTALLVERRGLGSMLKNRMLRVLGPFILFWPIVTLAISMPIGWALHNIDNLSPLLQMIKDSAGPQRSTSLLHLWFLYYLVCFYWLVWVFRRPPFGRLKQAVLNLHPGVAVLILPLALVPGLLAERAPFPAPEGFIPELWAIGFFGLFFAYGYALFSSTRHLNFFDRHWPYLVLISLVLSTVFLSVLPAQAELRSPTLPLISRLVLVLCTVYIAVLMSVACLVGAQKLLNQNNGFMRYMSDASYWIYISHLPVLLGIQYWLLDQPGGVWYKFILSSLATLAICVLSYMLFIRWSPVGWLLNGRRREPKCRFFRLPQKLSKAR